jgi:capsular polysaccharide biosynthesis protein
MTIAPPLPEHVELDAPPRGEPALGTIVRRFWWLMLLLGILLAVAGGVLASQRKPTYEAETRLTIANVDFATRSVPGFTQALETLASSYSQAVTNDAVVQPLAKRFDLGPAEIADRLSATPVPNSSVFAIHATGPDPKAAVDLATAAAEQTTTYVRSLDASDGQRKQALADFRAASRSAARIQETIDQMTADRAGGKTVSSSRLVAERERLASAQLRADVARSQYTELDAAPSAEARTISVLAPARSATSDKRTYQERFALIGAVAGIALGFVIAALLARRPRRRAAAA